MLCRAKELLIVEIKKGKNNQPFFRIKGPNGRIIAVSETYTNYHNLLRIVNKITNCTSWKIKESI